MNRRTALATLALGLHGAAAYAQRAPEAPLDAELLRSAGRCLLAGWRTRGVHPWAAARLAEDALGGVIVTRSTAPALPALQALTSQLRSCVVAADQEGGAVSHLSPPLVRMPPLTVFGAIDDEALTRRAGQWASRLLEQAGVNMMLGPVLDVSGDANNGVIAGRVFGGDAAKTARHGAAYVEGAHATSVRTCVKHFPGHGATHEDSHVTLPHAPRTVDELRAADLLPFAAVNGRTDAVMVAHVIYDGVDREFPATLSRRCATELLRETLGFRGVAVSDDLEMAPVRDAWGVGAAAVRAMSAGCDLLTIAHTPGLAEEARQALARRAADDSVFRDRLHEAEARIRETLRGARVATDVPSGTLGEFIAEVMRRAPRRAEVHRDPTR